MQPSHANKTRSSAQSDRGTIPQTRPAFALFGENGITPFGCAVVLVLPPLGAAACWGIIAKAAELLLLDKPFFPTYDGDTFRFVIGWYFALVFIAFVGLVAWMLSGYLDHTIGPPSRWIEWYKSREWVKTERARFRQLYKAMHGMEPPPGCEPSTLSLGMEYGGELGEQIEAKWRQTLRAFDRHRSEGQYLNGKRIGHWVYWHHNGRKLGEGEFIDGKPSGQWVFWKEDGTVDENRTYDNCHVPEAGEGGTVIQP